MLRKNIKTFSLLIAVFAFTLFSSNAFAAALFLEPAEAEYYKGDNFIVDIRIDTEGECINTVKADFKFSQDILEVVDFSQGESILTFWVEHPKVDQTSGLLSFVGGIPAGFCGRLPGDPGESNLIGKIIFRIPEEKEIEVPNTANIEFLETSQVLLNDGFGTLVDIKTSGAVFNVLAGTPELFKREWQGKLAQDKHPPEEFIITIAKNPDAFGGEYFAVFFTIDKETGLDYFEIKEGDNAWQKVESPYLLKDQKLESKIVVVAADKAGNKTVSEYLPLPKEIQPIPYFAVISIVLTGIIIILIFRKKSKKDS